MKTKTFNADGTRVNANDYEHGAIAVTECRPDAEFKREQNAEYRIFRANEQRKLRAMKNAGRNLYELSREHYRNIDTRELSVHAINLHKIEIEIAKLREQQSDIIRELTISNH